MKKENLLRYYFKYRLYIFPAVVALSSLFLIVFAIYPQTMKLVENRSVGDDLTNKSKLLDNKVAALESYSGENLSQKVKLTLGVLPADKDFLSALNVLQRLIAQSGFSITEISLSTGSSRESSADSFSIKLEVKGPRALFQALLDNFENSPRLFRISSISISSGQDRQAIDVGLGIEVLYAKLPQDFGKADSPLPELTQEDLGLIAKITQSSGTTMDPISNSLPSSPRGKANPFD